MNHIVQPESARSESLALFVRAREWVAHALHMSLVLGLISFLETRNWNRIGVAAWRFRNIRSGGFRSRGLSKKKFRFKESGWDVDDPLRKSTISPGLIAQVTTMEDVPLATFPTSSKANIRVLTANWLSIVPLWKCSTVRLFSCGAGQIHPDRSSAGAEFIWTSVAFPSNAFSHQCEHLCLSTGTIDN
jgi:hypothetical protein